MTVENKSYSDIVPVTLNLADPDRNLDLSIPREFSTQQGMKLLEYNFLLSAHDIKQKNFTTNFLTSKFQEDQIFDLKLPSDINRAFNTTLQFNQSADCFVTIDKNFGTTRADVFFSVLSSEDVNSTQNFVVNLSTAGDNMPVCQIYTYDGIYKKYLVQRSSVTNDTAYDLFFDQLDSNNPYEARSFFDVIVSDNSMRLSIFGDRSSITTAIPTRDSSFLIQKIGNTLSAAANPTASDYKESTITINNFNVDFDYYKNSNNFVNYVTGADIDSNLTIPEIDYNFLMYNNYESNTLSGEKIAGKINYFNLKNHISNHSNVNKNLNHTDPQIQREYTDIIVNEVEEQSEEYLKLNYNFYTAEYNFKPDNVTKFVLPESLAPYERININDADLQKSGAYAAQSPYFSDRVIKNIDTHPEVANAHNQRGEYLCSWLHDDGANGLWYDRYYIPANVNGLSGTGFYGPLFEISPDIDNILINSGLSGLNYYDVQSTLMFEPSGTYYYGRIGKKYVEEIIDSQSDDILKRNFNPRNIYDKSFIGESTDTLVLTPSSYDTFTFPVDNKGTKNSIHMSFGLTVPDFEKAKSYQLAGNLFNTGLGISKNFYFTPFIYLQQDNNMFFYDTDFNLIKTTNFPTITAIKDVLYLNQSNDFIIVGDGYGGDITLSGGRLIRASYTGDVQKENSDVIVKGLVESEYTSRVVFNIGSKAIVKSGNLPAGNNTFNIDLNSLVVDPGSNSFPAEDLSVVRRADNTITDVMSGFRGVNVDNTIGAAISGHNSIIFKDFLQDTTFLALSTDKKIWDINAFDEKLYVQTDNKLQVFNTSRDLLSTFNLSTSAVSGYKIDFVSEDYSIKPIVFSRGSDTNLIVDKLDLQSTGFTLSTYRLGISGVDLGYDFSTRKGWHINPTNLYSVNQTYKNFEDKFCFVTRFDNEFAANPSGRVWEEQGLGSPVLWESADSGNWSVNYTGAGGVIDDNSTLTIIENIRAGKNCIGLDIDLITGKTEVYVNGLKSVDTVITTGIKPLKNYLNNAFYIGLPNYSVNTISDFVTNQDFNSRNLIISDLYVYNTQLPKDLIMYHYLNCSTIDPVNFDILSGTRNNIETLDNFFSYKIPGSLSNRIKIYIKNANLTDNNAYTLANLITSKINSFLPKNITTIEYDFSIGNRVQLISDSTIVVDIPSIQGGVETEVGEVTFGPISDFLTYQDGGPATTEDNLFIYLD